MTTSTPTATKSGRFLVRMPPSLHAALDGAARAAGVSLNEYCVRRLASAGRADGDAATLLSRASSVTGDSLKAVLLHGSWARGEATAASDVDALVVVDRSVQLDRALYRLWDAESISWQGRPVDAHFIHVPKKETFSGLWAEAAIDGQVLFDRDGSVSEHLHRVRRAIAEGRLVRRVAQGQPYWTEAT
ncbi:MAG: toxin-antitoxin system HicB family antitoxin [Acidobacteria bacterium]|nr:toxin-antitoxin system HicB family antitoxin [Acidobacteriota bacterium]